MDSNTNYLEYFSELVSLVEGSFDEWEKEINDTVDPKEMAANRKESNDGMCGSTMYIDPESGNYVTVNYSPNEETVATATLSTLGEIWTVDDYEINRAFNSSNYISRGKKLNNVARVDIPENYEVRDVVKGLEGLEHAAREGIEDQLVYEPSNTS